MDRVETTQAPAAGASPSANAEVSAVPEDAGTTGGRAPTETSTSGAEAELIGADETSGDPAPGAAGVPEGPEGDSATGGEDSPLEEADAPAGIAELADGSPQEPADASEGGGAGASTTGDADAVEAAEATPVETAPAPMEEAEPTAPEDSRSLPPLEDTSQALARAARRYDAGQYESADALLDRILAQEPGWSEALMLRARVKLDREQYAPSLEAARKVTLLSPQVVEAHLIVGVCEEALGDPSAALAAYERFLKIAPEHPYATSIRRDVERLRGEVTP